MAGIGNGPMTLLWNPTNGRWKIADPALTIRNEELLEEGLIDRNTALLMAMSRPELEAVDRSADYLATAAKGKLFPNSLLCSQSMINLPIHPGLSRNQVEIIISIANTLS